VRPEGLGQFKKNAPHRDLKPRPSGLQHSYRTLKKLPIEPIFDKRLKYKTNYNQHGERIWEQENRHTSKTIE
jgi:hypothetical protein